METSDSSNPFWRQGDIYFVKIGEEADSAESRPVKNGVIAKGETTGHAHRVSQSSMTAGALLYLVGRSMFLRSPQAGAKIVHDEHHAIDLPKGLYAVVPQQEFDGLRWRQVLD
jgi:hypothetical protein